MQKVCVIGAAMGNFGKLQNSAREEATIVARAAIESAEIDVKDINESYIGNIFWVSEKQVHIGPLIMEGLGHPYCPSSTVESACASSSTAFRHAYVSVAGGFNDVALVIGVEKVSTLSTMEATGYFAMGGDYPFEAMNGATFPGLYATIARAHMHKYGTTSEQLAKVAVKNHKNALHNPHAHFKKEITIDTVLNSFVVSHPLHLFDCCPFSDGAAAVVIASEEYARKHAHTDDLIFVAGSGRAGNIPTLQDRVDMAEIKSTQIAAKKAFEQAKIQPKDIDFAEVHDCFTIAEILATEDIGFFNKGYGGKAVDEGLTELGSLIPINPSGGLKAKGHPVGATGTAQIVEVYEQFTGKAGKRTVEGAEYALCQNVGATGGSCSVHIFKRGGN